MMRTPISAPARAPLLQRKCACGSRVASGGECAQCKRNRESLQGKSADALSRPEIPSPVRAVIGSAGRPLEPGTRSMMEERFGHDFSAVRVHADPEAGRSAEAVDALAYTVGTHVAFAAGRYAPHTADGRRLLAHELTHVVQQIAGEAGSASAAREEAEADRVADAAARGATLPEISPGRIGLRKQGAPTAPSAEADAFRAEFACDLPALCRLHFANPRTVDVARVSEAYRRCGRPAPMGLDPCLSVSTLPPTGGFGPRTQPGPTVAPPKTGGGAAGGAGLHLPSTKLQFHLGDLKAELDLPSSLTATLPVSYRGAQVVAFKLQANTSGDFSLTVTVDAVPHVRISLRAGVKVGGTPQGSAGLVIEATDTVCHAEDPLTAREKLNSAGKKLHDAVQAAQKSAQPEKLADVVSAIAGVHSAIDAAKAKCKKVTRAKLEFGAHTPLGPFEPHTPPASGDLGTAPYVGGTLTIPFD